MGESHWIGSVRFELSSSDGQWLEPVRRSLRDDHETILLRPLQRALDRADHRGRLTRRRRIEIDLGQIRSSEIGEALGRRIATSVRLELGLEDVDAGAPSAGIDVEELLLAFLATGHVGWPAAGRALEQIFIELEAKGQVQLATLAARLRLLFDRRPEAVERFVRQCPIGLIVKIAANLGGASVVPGARCSAASTYADEDEARRLGPLVRRLARREALSALRAEWLGQLAARAGQVWTAAGSEMPISGVALGPSESAQAPAFSEARSSPAPPEDRAPEETVPRNTLSLEAAGAVLLYPFLAGLCGACDLVGGDGSYRGAEARSRAVLLFHYSATGERQAAEPELALAKLLCGLEPEETVPRSIVPSRGERREVDALLKAVISHWTALGDSSAHALRETFLKRPGRLGRDANGWRLEVEQSGVDILLDRLPWTIGLVMTPFMARPLRVDWR